MLSPSHDEVRDSLAIFFLSSICLLFTYGEAYCADTIIKSFSIYRVPRATIKVNVPCLFDPGKSSLFAAADVRLASQWTADLGAGWFFGSWGNPLQYEGERMNGLRLRMGIKYHYVVSARLGPYVGVEGKMNYIEETRYSLICRWGCQYLQEMPVTFTTHTYGGALKTGLQSYLGVRQRFLIDIYLGMGFKFLQKKAQLPSDADMPPARDWDIFNFVRSPGNYRLPDFLWGFYFGYCFAR